MSGDGRAMASLVGNILLVAVVVVLAVVLTIAAFTFLEETGTPTADATFEYEQTPVGLKLTPVAMGTDVVVRLNGDPVAEIASESAGQPVLVPTAPGDTLTIVSRDGDRSVLVRREIDEREEIGNLVSYYPFERGTDPGALRDRSGNGNDGELRDDSGATGPQWSGCGLQFDGSDDNVLVENLSAPVDVEEFTIAVAYEQTGSSDRVNQLVEHQFASGGEWFIETSPDTGESYTDGYSVDFAVEYPGAVASSNAVSTNTRHVVVGTYDGSSYALYVDGERVDSGTHSERVEMGDLRFGRDFESSSQYLDGQLCEARLYFSAFDATEVAQLTAVMDE